MTFKRASRKFTYCYTTFYPRIRPCLWPIHNRSFFLVT